MPSLQKKGLIHQNVILAKAPEILTLALNRNKYHGTLSDLVIDTPIKIERILNVSDIVMGTEPHAVLEYTLIGVLEKKGDSIDSGHFVTYIIHSDEVCTRYDDHNIDVQPIDYYLEDLSLMEGVCMLLYRKGKRKGVRRCDRAPGCVNEKSFQVKEEEIKSIINLWASTKTFAADLSDSTSLKCLLPPNQLHGSVIQAFLTSISNSQIISMPVELYVALKGGRRSKVNNFALEKPAKDTRLILIPVSLGIHWTLIGIYIVEKVVIYLDSAVSPVVNVFRNILGYLERLFVHWKVPFSIEEWLLLAPRNVPKQKDNYSCGVFLCLNAYVLSSNDIVHYEADNVNKYRYWIAAKIIGGKHPPQLKLGNEQAERIYQSSSDIGRYIHHDIPDGTEAENQGFFHSRLLKLLCTRRELSNAPKEPPLFSDDENDSFISEIFPSEPKEEEYDSQQSSSVSRSVLSKTSSHSKTTKEQATI